MQRTAALGVALRNAAGAIIQCQRHYRNQLFDIRGTIRVACSIIAESLTEYWCAAIKFRNRCESRENYYAHVAEYDSWMNATESKWARKREYFEPHLCSSFHQFAINSFDSDSFQFADKSRIVKESLKARARNLRAPCFGGTALSVPSERAFSHSRSHGRQLRKQLSGSTLHVCACAWFFLHLITYTNTGFALECTLPHFHWIPIHRKVTSHFRFSFSYLISSMNLPFGSGHLKRSQSSATLPDARCRRLRRRDLRRQRKFRSATEKSTYKIRFSKTENVGRGKRIVIVVFRSVSRARLLCVQTWQEESAQTVHTVRQK